VIEPGNRSRYILRPREDVPGADVLGAVFEFHLRIENTGRRNSTITNYRVRIQELQRDYADLAVFENQTSVRGRRAQMGISRDSVLSRNGIIEVHAERTTPRGTLLFRIPDLNLQMFADAGLRMEEQDRKFSPLHCTLTISDSTGTTTSNDFVLSED
jgi:hypothetical protein